MISLYKKCSNTINVKRWDFATQKEIDMLAPALVIEYNSFMGQVDNVGRLFDAFRIKMAVKRRFYMQKFFIFVICQSSIRGSCKEEIVTIVIK